MIGAFPPCRKVESTAHHNHGLRGRQILHGLVRALVGAEGLISQSARNIHDPGGFHLMILPCGNDNGH